MATSQEIQQLKVYITAHNKQFVREIKNTNKRLDSFQRSSQRHAAAVTKSLTGMFAVFSAGAVAQKAIKTLADFEFQMDKVAAISGASQAEIQKLEKNARDLGAASQFTATEIGKLQEELARLGFTTNQIVNMTDAARKLAQVADAELGQAAKVVGQQINAFGLSAKESTRVANVMAESFSKSALDLEQFAVGMSFAASAGKAAGFTIEEVTAMLGALVDSGIQGSKAGTALRDIFADLSVKGITLEEALNQIETSTNKNKTAFDLFGKTSMNASIILAEAQGKVTGLTKALSDNVNELDSMTKIMEDNLLTDWKLFLSSIDAVILKAGPINSVLRAITQDLTRLNNSLVDDSSEESTIESLNKQLDDLNRKREILSKNVNTGDIYGTNNTFKVAEVDEEIQELEIKVKKINSILRDVRKHAFEGVEDGAVSASEQLERLNKKLELYSTSPFFDVIKNELTEDLDKVTKAIDKQAEAAAKASREYELWAGNQREVFKTLKGKGINPDDITKGDTFGKLTVDDIIAPDFTQQMEDKYNEILGQTFSWRERMDEQFSEFGNAVENTLKRAISSTAEAIGTLAVDRDLEQFYKNILGIMADGIRNMGQLLIAQGSIELAAFSAPPPAKIALGAASVALATAISAASRNMGDSVNAASGGYGGSTGNARSVLQGQSIKVEINGELRGQGSDLVAILDNYETETGRGG